jgi:hypothetical protein
MAVVETARLGPGREDDYRSPALGRGNSCWAQSGGASTWLADRKELGERHQLSAAANSDPKRLSTPQAARTPERPDRRRDHCHWRSAERGDSFIGTITRRRRRHVALSAGQRSHRRRLAPSTVLDRATTDFDRTKLLLFHADLVPLVTEDAKVNDQRSGLNVGSEQRLRGCCTRRDSANDLPTQAPPMRLEDRGPEKRKAPNLSVRGPSSN